MPHVFAQVGGEAAQVRRHFTWDRTSRLAHERLQGLRARPVRRLLPRLPERKYVVVCSILRDKRPELLLEALSVLGETLLATSSSNARAMAAEVPVVAAAAGGLTEIVRHCETGLLVPRSDTHAMAEAILSLLAKLDGSP